METDDRHEGERVQTTCIGCDCIAHEVDSNEKEESEVIEKLHQILNQLLTISPVANVILADVDHVNLHVQPAYEEIFMQTFPLPDTMCQVKPAGKIAYYLHAASQPSDINKLKTIEEVWSGRECKWLAKSYRQRISVTGNDEDVGFSWIVVGRKKKKKIIKYIPKVQKFPDSPDRKLEWCMLGKRTVPTQKRNSLSLHPPP